MRKNVECRKCSQPVRTIPYPVDPYLSTGLQREPPPTPARDFSDKNTRPNPCWMNKYLSGKDSAQQVSMRSSTCLQFLLLPEILVPMGIFYQNSNPIDEIVLIYTFQNLLIEVFVGDHFPISSSGSFHTKFKSLQVGIDK